METGADVWLRDKVGKAAWLPAIIQSKVRGVHDNLSTITVRTTTGEEFTFSIDGSSDNDLDDVKLRNAFEDADTEDLINLPYLHEPAILCCLEQRYGSSNIYTYTGPILIAVNPFKKVNLYSTQILESYYNFGLLKSQGIEHSSKLPPHVYAVADAAFRNMMNGIHNSSASNNQSILISGESGAGKTESTKIVLRYLTTVGNSSGSLELAVGSVMDKILQSNPILEAFGNARTIRNDNSSRFGKFIELNFNRRGHLIGGMIRHYLLEKVRLPTQQPGERNFHVFYQMIIGGSDEDMEDWNLENIEEYWYTNQGGIYELEHVDDGDEYRAMRAALNTLNFPQDQQVCLFRILAGLLHLGQVQFVADSDGEGSEVSPDELSKMHLENTSRLLGLSVSDIARTLTIRTINARTEVFEKKLTLLQASDAKDALAKSIYGQIFQWLVQNINRSILVDTKNVRADIGVLDIFGFECFKQNSFEQLCINYTNETLQQQFNQFIFKMEQLEYQKENIEWSFVEFPDNQDCLDLIEHKVNGILAMIDDECKLPKASDEKLAARMYKAFESNKRFSASVTQKRDWLFCINHYAGPVVYSTLTFVDKNKDELPRESFSLLQLSSNSLMSKLFESSATQEKGNQSLASVGSQFKEQLASLMNKIYSTSPHYIRCLKPNDQNLPDCLDRVRITEQLRYGGVLEAVRVARSGFPVRLIHVDFYSTYRPLINPFASAAKQLPRVLKPDKHNQKNYCQMLISALFDTSNNILHPSMTSWKKEKVDKFMEWSGSLMIPTHNIQLGQSKVFLRKSAHDMLEAKRSKRLLYATVVIQSKIRCYITARRYAVAKKAVGVLQRAFRVYKARKTVAKLRKLKACILIQTNIRRFMNRFKFLWLRSAILSLQRHFRRHVACKFVEKLRYYRYVNRLQAVVRLLIDIHRFRRYRKAVVKLQSGYRRSQAKKVLKVLRAEAKDIGKLQQSNESLKLEIEMLKAKALEDAKRLELQIQREAEEKSAISKQKEMSTLLENIESLKQSLEREKIQRQLAETKLVSAEEKCSSLEYLIQTEYLPKLQKWREFPEIESQLSIARSKLSEVEEKLKLQHDTILKLESEKSHSTEDKTSSYQSPAKWDSIPSRHGSINSGNVYESDISQLELLSSQLREEKALKEVLEDEITRLRLISLDLNAQLESMKRNVARGRSSFVQPLSTPGGDESSQPSEPTSSRLRRSSIGNTPTSAINRRPSMPSMRTPMTIEITKESKDEGNPEEALKAFSPLKTRRRQSTVIEQATLAGSIQPIEPVGVMEKFEKNIEILQQKLKIGVVGQLDGTKIIKTEAVMKLDDVGKMLTFSPMSSNRRFTFFSSHRLEIDAIRISSILECSAGSSIASEATEDYRLLTITCSGDNAPRVVSFKVSSREERNALITSIRALSSSSQINPSTPQNQASSVKHMKKRSMREAVLEESAQATSPAASSGRVPPAPISSHQPKRRTSQHPPNETSSNPDANLTVEELRRSLQIEKAKNDKSLQQIVQLTNDLLEREDQILELKRREAEFTQKIQAKDKLYEQDASVRMQLGKKLEQVLMDKEDALEQVGFLKDQLAIMNLQLDELSRQTSLK